MKRILITGANSYLGESLAAYLAQWPGAYQTDTVSLRGEAWRARSFGGYDAVYHVAGIAHADVGKVTEERKRAYYRVNTELAIETAKKAKADGAGQFILMSSVIVYGASAPVGRKKVITRDTEPQPENFYGDSKLRAEKGVLPLADDAFRVAVIRAPMIYGKGCKGNYRLLAELARLTPVFPAVDNERSMLYVKNLMEFVRLLVENREEGIFWPQNREYVRTADMVREIAAVHGKKMMLLPGFQWLLGLLSHVTGLVNKAFGSLVYDQTLSEYKEDYRKYDLPASIRETEGT